MRLRKLTPSVTELYINGMIVLFSYETPVAAEFNGTYYRSSKRWSKITLKQITMWLNDRGVDKGTVIEVDQEWLDNLFNTKGENHVSEKKQGKPKK